MDSPKVYNLADKSLYTKALSKLYNNLVASQLGKIVKIICWVVPPQVCQVFAIDLSLRQPSTPLVAKSQISLQAYGRQIKQKYNRTELAVLPVEAS